MAEPETVVFLRAEDNEGFERLAYKGRDSITMQCLLDEFGITSVVECSEDGSTASRGLALRSPSSKLRKGGHYIVRERKKEQGPEKPRAVLFESKVNVTEFRPSQAGPCGPDSRSQSQCFSPPLDGKKKPQDEEEDALTNLRAIRIKRQDGTEQLVTGAELREHLHKDTNQLKQRSNAHVSQVHSSVAPYLAGTYKSETRPTSDDRKRAMAAASNLLSQ